MDNFAVDLMDELDTARRVASSAASALIAVADQAFRQFGYHLHDLDLDRVRPRELARSVNRDPVYGRKLAVALENDLTRSLDNACRIGLNSEIPEILELALRHLYAYLEAIEALLDVTFRIDFSASLNGQVKSECHSNPVGLGFGNVILNHVLLPRFRAEIKGDLAEELRIRREELSRFRLTTFFWSQILEEVVSFVCRQFRRLKPWFGFPADDADIQEGHTR